MRVFIVTDYWKNGKGGGVTTYLVNLVDTLKQKGSEVDVFFRKGEDPKQFRGNQNKLAFSVSCIRLIRKRQPDVIHSQGSWYCLLPGVIGKKLCGCRLIHTFHTEPIRKISLPGRVLFQVLLNECDCVTFVSKRLKDCITQVEDLKFLKSAITYAGVKACKVSDNEVQQFRQRFGIADDAIVLLAIGMTALPYKAQGLKILIRAVKILHRIYPNLVLVATQEDMFSEELKAFVQDMDMGEVVIFTGEIENPYVPLKFCNIYTHITLGDGLPLALLEAMSMGKPIIATPIAGIPEAIEDGVNGFLVIPEPRIIAEKIQYLLQNADVCRSISEKARATAEDTFTWNNAAMTFMSLYNEKNDITDR